MGADDVTCGIDTSVTDKQCFDRTPEVSTEPSYTLHFVEFDDQGWLYPGPDDKENPAKSATAYQSLDCNDKGQPALIGSANDQIERAVRDVACRLANNERVFLLVYIHGWRHGSAHDDRDVKRFRQMLSDAALIDKAAGQGGVEGGQTRSVVGIYVGWRGAGRLSPTNPLTVLSFWTRKNAALHVSAGAVRELFARLHALRARWNAVDAGRPGLRTVVIGHSFGGWVAFSALSPSILELLAQRADLELDRDAWRQARLRSAADVVILVNPAFEATRYQPIHNLAQRVGERLPEYEPPILLLVTSTADAATGTAFPIGRFFNTLFQRPFTSDEEAYTAKRTPGFVDRYVTHELRGGTVGAPRCSGWQLGDKADPSTEAQEVHSNRMLKNAYYERRRHEKWRDYLAGRNQSLPNDWTWQYCGGTTIFHKTYAPPHTPVWNIITDGKVITGHSDITGEPLHAFFRQIYLDLAP